MLNGEMGEVVKDGSIIDQVTWDFMMLDELLQRFVDVYPVQNLIDR